MGYAQMKPYSALASYLLDTEDDLTSLPSSPAGSIAELADGSKKWVLAPSGEWAEEEISSGGGGEGGSGATNVFEYIKVVMDKGNFTTTIAPEDFLKYCEKKPENLLVYLTSADGSATHMIGVSPTYLDDASIRWYVFEANIDYHVYMTGNASGNFAALEVGYDGTNMNVFFRSPESAAGYLYWKQSNTK